VSGAYTVGPEGRIQLTALGNPRIEGQTTAVLTDRVAAELGLLVAQVKCRVVEHQSRVIFVHGPIEGGDRAVLYRGPESVVSFLRCCGGLTRGADVRDIAVVRGNVARGTKPQVLPVDLEAILLRGEAESNVLLQPFDQVCIGELPRSKFGRALPHWLRPLYRGLCGAVPSLCPHDWRQQIRDPEP
jgi:protein involved in polysaccharide export with SLBB domain